MDRKILNPVIDRFVSDLEKIENNKLSEVKSLEKENEKARELQDNLKDQIKNNENRASFDKKKMKDKENEIVELKETLNKEICETNRINQRKKDELHKIEQEKKSQEELKKITSEELARQRVISQNYKDKLNLLKVDEDNNKTDALKVTDRERKVELRERKCLNDEQAYIEKSAKLTESELDNSSEKKRLKLEKKRLEAYGK